MLKDKTVVIGVSGGIAVYKTLDVVSRLRKLGVNVNVIMTKSATEFVTPLSFQSLSQNYVVCDMFEDPKTWDVEHISLAKRADVFLIAPATANVIGKIANGIADDMLTTTVMATKAKVLIAPAMNTNMYENPILQRNINTLKELGYNFVEPESGRLACGDTGKGKLPDPEVLEAYILKAIAREKDMKGVKILVTAGPTREAIDPVRYITNHSTGKMGYAIAKQAMLRGADVTLVTGKVEIAPPMFVNTVDITSAQDMYDEVMARSREQDVIVKAAAVADYKPAEVAEHKIKKNEGDMSIKLSRTKDILLALGNQRIEEGIQDQIICGFSMETRDLIENSRKKIDSKHIDMIAANNLKVAGAGFGVDTNVLTLITKDGISELPMMSKEDCADKLLDRIMEMRKADQS